MKRASKSAKPKVSLILTGYNEGDGLEINLNTAREILLGTRYTWEILLIDDKSKDKTPKIFSEFAKGDKRIKAYFHKKNQGRGATVTEGIRKARGEIVGYIDTDMELSPIYIPEFIREITKGADIAVAKRIYTIGASNLIRAIASRGYVFLVQRLLNVNLTDTESGFKFFRRSKILPLLNKIQDKRWFFDTEVVVQGYWNKLSLIEIPVVYLRKPEKQSSVHLIDDSIDYFKKLLTFRKNNKHYLK